MKCSSGSSFEFLERIYAPEKQISIGWKPLSSSVAFLSCFKKIKIAIFTHIYSALKADSKPFSPKCTKKGVAKLEKLSSTP